MTEENDKILDEELNNYMKNLKENQLIFFLNGINYGSLIMFLVSCPNMFLFKFLLIVFVLFFSIFSFYSTQKEFLVIFNNIKSKFL